MHKILAITLPLLLTICPTITAKEIISSSEQNDIEWGIYLDVAGTGGTSGIGFEPSVFIPIKPSVDGIILIDLRGQVGTDFNGAEGSGSLAVGYRHRLNEVAVGVNGSLDLLSSPNGNALAQGSLGVEFFSKYVNVAMNFYAPLTKAQDTGSSSYAPYAVIEENELKMVYKDNDLEVTRYGVDLFVQASIPLIDNMFLELAGGVVYYFATEDYDGVFAAGASAKLGYEFDLFGQDAETYVMADLGYDTQDGLDFMVTLGLKISLGGNSSNDKREKYYNQYNEKAGFMKSDASIATYQGQLHKENATTIVDGNEYHYIYEGDANDDIVAMIDGSREDALVVLNGDAGEINITEGITLKDGQYLTGTGQALVVNGPDGRQAIILVGGSRATVSGGSKAPLFTLSADNTVNGLNINGAFTGIYVGEGHDAKIIDVDLSNVVQGIEANSAGQVTIDEATISESFIGVFSNGSSKLFIRNSSISAQDQALLADGNETITIEETYLFGNVVVTGNSGDVTFINTTASENVTINNDGNIILNGVTIGEDLNMVSEAGTINVNGLTTGRSVYVSAKKIVEMLNADISGDLLIEGEGELFEIILSVVHAGGDITLDNPTTITGFQVTADGTLYINCADIVSLEESDDPVWGCENIPTYTKDGETIDLDTDDDLVRNDLDECPDNPNTSVQYIYYEDLDDDGLGDPNSFQYSCADEAPTGWTDNPNDNSLNDHDNDGVTDDIDECPNDPTASTGILYYADLDDDGLGDPNNSTTICSATAPTGHVDNSDDINDEVAASNPVITGFYDFVPASGPTQATVSSSQVGSVTLNCSGCHYTWGTLTIGSINNLYTDVLDYYHVYAVPYIWNNTGAGPQGEFEMVQGGSYTADPYRVYKFKLVRR